MHTEYPAALGTGPSFLFISHELSYAGLLYVHEIVNHTHSILGSIALIQVIQSLAGKAVTTEAILKTAFRQVFAVFDSAHDTGFGFIAVITTATPACLFPHYKCATETAIHSTGSDQRRSHRICLY
jgi:hypothetical protein